MPGLEVCLAGGNSGYSSAGVQFPLVSMRDKSREQTTLEQVQHLSAYMWAESGVGSG